MRFGGLLEDVTPADKDSSRDASPRKAPLRTMMPSQNPAIAALALVVERGRGLAVIAARRKCDALQVVAARAGRGGAVPRGVVTIASGEAS